VQVRALDGAEDSGLKGLPPRHFGDETRRRWATILRDHDAQCSRTAFEQIGEDARIDGMLMRFLDHAIESRGERSGVRVTTPRIHDSRNVLDAVVELAARCATPSDLRENGSAEAAEAHRRLEANAVTRGRIVLEIPPVASRA
jgi:hypothetical protein